MTSTVQTSPFVQPVMSASDSLLISLFASTIFHTLIILGLNSTTPLLEKINKPIEITLAILPAKKAPKKAKFLAQDNQQGAGKEVKKPKPPKQKTPSQGTKQNKKPAPRKSQPRSQPKGVKKLITQTKAVEKIVTAKKPAPPSVKKTAKITYSALKRQIAQLGSEIRHSKQSSEKSKIKFVNAVNTHKTVAAQYQKDWEQKIEKVGNLNFPEAAKKKGFSNTLTMDVGINANGRITGISIIKSSGNKALDDAAKQIVMLSAPFPALPKELLQELDILRIRRIWNFSDESRLSAQ
ncbi:MAG: TonB family protein [Methylococcales symbiont of Hymedesmia sp. n. MRB-2018]|nr:MAG: TonB family protein [Methylococcales symbiont of Hymedesmia sp. n. MRB-2018]